MLQNGTKLGPYEISGFVGAGGMGEVYRAHDARIGREVAIKILPAGFSADQDRLRRFEQEARAAGLLNHGNILAIYDVGTFNNSPYLVSELLEGETLRERLSAGHIPRRKSMEFAMQIVNALAAAHEKGIVHRDLKPENLFVMKDGRLKILDFGLAKLIGAEPAANNQSSLQTAAGQSEPGLVVGTVGYMSPEQVRGQASDHRSDLFSFGSIFYEMLTGKRAFHGNSVADTMSSIMHEDPPDLADSDPNLPAAFQRVISRCLEKSPEERFQSTRDLSFALEAVSGVNDSKSGRVAALDAGETIITPRAKPRTISDRIPWIIAGLAIALSAALAWIHFKDTKQELPLMYSAIVPPDKSSFQLSGSDSGALTISPDGRYITFLAKGEDGKASLWLRPLDSAAAHPLEGTDGATNPFWSPDSRFLAFFSGDKLKKVDIQGGPPLNICSVGNNPRPGTWNKEGIIVFELSSVDGLYRVSAAGGTPTPVTTVDATSGETTHRWATFLPDGRTFLYMAGTHTSGTQSETNAIYAAKLDSKDRKLLLHARSNVRYAAGYLLYVRDNVLVAHPFDPEKLEFTGNPVPITEGVQYDTGFFHAAFAVSDNGTLVYRQGQPNRDTQMKWVDREGKETSVVGDPASYQTTVLSPSEDRAIAVVEDQKSGISDLWMIDLQRNVKSRFTFTTGGVLGPIWSPDGSKIVYSGVSKGNGPIFDLYVKPSAGSATEELLLTTSGQHKLASSWSPDGRYIAFSNIDIRSKLKTGIMIFSMQDHKAKPFLESEFNVTGGQFSPDGHWFLYQSDESGQDETYLAPFPGPGGKWQISSGGSTGAAWNVRGDEIDYSRSDGTFTAVPVKMEGENVQIGSPQKLFQNAAIIDWSQPRDDKHFLIIEGSKDSLDAPITIVTNWTSILDKLKP